METAFRYLFISIIPAFLAYKLASRVGRRRGRWAVACFFTSYLGLLLLAFLPTRAIPMLEQYRRPYPECATKGGLKCAQCSSRSIRL